jgi:digeranylgeranylglycerophospholipid reductase
MKENYDFLVIGGGPGGAIAARTAAAEGYSVLLVEKRPAIGAPVRCAEGIGKEALAEFVKPDDRWISAEIQRAELVAPDGVSMMLESEMAGSKVGYILDRKFFDRELVWQAAEAGAEVMVKTRASGPIIQDGRVRGAVVDFCGHRQKVHADLTIAADGVESKFTRWCGMDTTVPVREIMSSAQFLMTDIDVDPATTVFYLGNKVAPEGYLWIFPKGERTANVGIGISGKKSGPGHRARDYLERFVAEKFPHGKTIECVVGGVSVCRPLPETVADGLMVIGDAARVVDPLTGGGIYNAMFTGRLAVEVGSKALGAEDVSREALMDYDRGWRESPMGKTIARNWHIKEKFITLSDAKLNALIHSAKAIDLKDFSTISLIKEIMKRNPLLLADLAGLMKSIG